MPTVAARHKNRYQKLRKSRTNEEKSLNLTMVCGCLLHCFVLEFFIFLFHCMVSFGMKNPRAVATPFNSTPCGDTKTSKLNKLSPKQQDTISNDKKANTPNRTYKVTVYLSVLHSINVQTNQKKCEFAFPIKRFRF